MRRPRIVRLTTSLVLAGITAGCQDLSTERQVEARKGPDDAPNFYTTVEYSEACRMFDGGTTAKWVGPGSYWEGPCEVGLATSPSPPYIYQSDPQPVTFTFSGAGVVEAEVSIVNDDVANWCPTTAMQYTAYDQNDSVLASAPVSHNCGHYAHSFKVTAPLKRLVVTPPSPVPASTDGDDVSLYFIINYYTPPDTTFRITSLDCTPSPVVRAETVTCNAAWNPTDIPADSIYFSWRFEGDSVRVFPAAGARGYAPPPPVDSASWGTSSWSGQAVLNGRVRLQAQWSGRFDSTSTRLAVSARTGPEFGDLPVSFDVTMEDMETDHTKTLAQQPHPNGAAILGVIGQNYDTLNNDGDIRFAIHSDSLQMAHAAGGPNDGFWYIAMPGVRSTRGFRLRTWLTGRESPMFSYSLSPVVLTNRGLLAARRKNLNSPQAMHRDSSDFLFGVVSHETYGQNGARGHQGEIEVAARSLLTCGKVPAILEGVVAEDTNQLDARVFDVVEEGRKSLYAAAWHDRVYGNYSSALYYEVVAGTTVADNLSWKTGPGDVATASAPALAPKPMFGCTRNY